MARLSNMQHLIRKHVGRLEAAVEQGKMEGAGAAERQRGRDAVAAMLHILGLQERMRANPAA